ncbi:hypothetical protein ABS71_07620 [bacterium SCN 62-11]|nr:hypothetical protein [Candidatus Eremiobacteraeota bacterium]ODT72836.1 MAG: hypothetical protein ABS71_07620 [bacterium SCN 62-11]
MKKLFLFLLLLLAPLTSMGALLNVDTDYLVTEVNQNDRTFGIALTGDNPDVTQNDVYFGDDSKCFREVHLRNGTMKEYRVTVDKFVKLLHKGDRVHVKGGRDWDGSIHGYTVRIKTYE